MRGADRCGLFPQNVSAESADADDVYARVHGAGQSTPPTPPRQRNAGLDSPRPLHNKDRFLLVETEGKMAII